MTDKIQRRKTRHFVDILAKVVSIMGNALDRRQVEQADAIVKPAVRHVGSARFDLSEGCIAWGCRAAEEVLPQLLALANREGQS